MNDYKFYFKDGDKEILGQVKDGYLVEYLDLNNRRLGNIYRARINKYIRNLDAFEVDLGLDKPGLLRRTNALNNIKPGDQVLVEIIKEPIDHKSYEVSQKISLANPYIVLVPYSNKKSDRSYPYFLRTKGKEASREDLDGAYQELESSFEELKKTYNQLPCPKLVYESNFKKEYLSSGEDKVISNVKTPYTNIYDQDFNPNYKKEISLGLASINQRAVDDDDISISIDSLEALTVIDVNSKAYGMDMDKAQMARQVNIKACRLIARQASLRQIKKMVLIDFIREDNKIRDEIIDVLSKEFEKVSVKYKIMGWSNLGLLEIILF